MYAKKIKYEDYEGNEREETFYFNLSKAELIQLELSTTGGLEKMIKKITEEQDQQKLADLFKKIILISYGEKSADGKYFLKNDGELAKMFSQTEAFSELYWELATSTDSAVDFINGIIPKNLREQMAKIGAE